MRHVYLTSLFIAFMTAQVAVAGPVTGTVTGNFANPDKTGNVLLPTGGTQFYDNTASAGFLGLGSTAFWGNIPPTPTFGASSVEFVGNVLTNVPGDTEVALGTIKFFNGTSEFSTLIFGLDLTLDVFGTPDPNVDPLGLDISITTTANSVIDPDWDADFLTISGLPGGDVTLHAYEGQLVEAILFGKFIGDPQIELTDIQVTSDPTTGFLGSGPLTPPLPLPSTLALIGLGLAGLGFNKYRSR